MDREKFQQRLDAVLDRREQPSQDAELRRMADRDRDCAEMLEVAQLLEEGIELLDRPAPRFELACPSMADRVLAAVRVERGFARYLRIWVPFCVAAALLLSAIPLYRALQDADEKPAIAKPAVDPSEPTRHAEVASEADYLVQTHRAGEALGEVIWSTRYDQLSPAQKEWVARATAEISPVADPMANTVAITVDAVIRTIEPKLPR